MVAFGVLGLGEHISAPDGPCCGCGYEAGEAEEEVLSINLVWGSLFCELWLLELTREFIA
jgi:hypothetical protein